MQEDVHYLYKITNLVNGKLYIGVTKNPKHRQLCHFNGYHPDRLISKAVLKYGKENLIFEILCEGSKEYIYDLEPKAINLFNSNAEAGHGYNLCVGGVINNQVNKGKSILKRVDDKPVYVSGFWFPNRRTSLKSLNWGVGKFNTRNKKGLLGDLQVIRERKYQESFYLDGFWFPDRKTCLDRLTITLHYYEKQRRLNNINYEDL